MKALLISIGDELLIGQVVNTNASWMAEHLNLIGIEVSDILTIADSKNAIKSSIESGLKDHDIVLITGGLGPTKDDITKLTLAELFNSKLVIDEPTFARNKALFEKRGYEFTETNQKQAEIPEAATAIVNCCGTAPGMWFDISGKIVVSMPGVPFEMKAMMEEQILPRLKKVNGNLVIVHKTIMTHGIGESFLSDMIAPWEDALPNHIKLAYLPRPGILRLRLSAYGNNKEALTDEVNKQVEGLKKIIPQYIYGYDEESLESVVSQMLKDKNKTVSTAESCTGGYLAHCFTSLPGSSRIFNGGVVAYANEVKINILGVKSETIAQHGAVSEETVKEMAAGAKKQMQTDYAIATSGIAGPDGGTEQKPVGTVWVGIATPEKVIAKHFYFNANRERNIILSSYAALGLLRQMILSES